MVFCRQRWAPVNARLHVSYVSFQASESNLFVDVTQRVVEDRVLSSYSFIFAA